MTTRQFLFCFPLRLGSIIFGYTVILIALEIVAFHSYEVGVNSVVDYHERAEKFNNYRNLENVLDAIADSSEKFAIKLYHISYIVIGTLLFIFAIMFTCGVYQANRCLVFSFFVYSFFHLAFSVLLIVWEVRFTDWIQLSLIILSDVLLVNCLFGVKYLMEAIRTGEIYCQPEEIPEEFNVLTNV